MHHLLCQHNHCTHLQVPSATAAAASQRAPPPVVRPPAPHQPGLLSQGLPRAAAKPTFRPAALRLDDQGREVDEFGNLVQTKTESITTLKVPTMSQSWSPRLFVYLCKCMLVQMKCLSWSKPQSTALSLQQGCCQVCVPRQIDLSYQHVNKTASSMGVLVLLLKVNQKRPELARMNQEPAAPEKPDKQPTEE